MPEYPVGVRRRRSSLDRTPTPPATLGLSTGKTPNPDTTSLQLTYPPAGVPPGGTPVTGYRVYLDGIQVATVAAAVTEPVVGRPAQPIDPGVTYQLQIAGVNSYGEGLKTPPLPVTTLAVTTPPPAPVAAAGPVTATTVVITWQPVTYEKGPPTYEVYDTTTPGTPTATGGAAATSVTLTGLTPATGYVFTVRAVDPTNPANRSAESNPVRVTTTTTTGTGGGVTPGSVEVFAEQVGVNWHAGFPGTYGADQTVQYATTALRMAVLDTGITLIRDRLLTSNNTHIRDVHTWFAGQGGKYLLLCGKDRAQGTTPAAAATHVAGHLDATQWAGASYVAGIRALEGINEPNNEGITGWEVHTRNLQQALWDAAKTRNTGTTRLDQVPVLGPSLANRVGVTNSYTVDYGLLGDLSTVCDTGSLHIYNAGLEPTNRLAEIRDASRVSFPPPIPLWCTETGYHDALSTTTNKQALPDDVIAQYLPRSILEHLRASTAPVFLYEGLDDPDPANADIQANFGLIETPTLTQSTWTRKPQWYALRRFLRLMAQTPTTPPQPLTPLVVTLTGGGSGFRWGLWQDAAGRYRLVLWRNVRLYQNGGYLSPTPATATVTFDTPRDVEVHRPNEGGQAWESAAAQTLSQVTSVPVTLVGAVAVLVF